MELLDDMRVFNTKNYLTLVIDVTSPALKWNIHLQKTNKKGDNKNTELNVNVLN